MPDDKEYEDLLAEFEEREQLKSNVLEAKDVPETEIDSEKGESYKEQTGRDLDMNAGGYNEFSQPSEHNEISDKVAEEAKEAAEPITNPEAPTDSKEEYQYEDLLEEFEKEENSPAPMEQENEQEQDFER